MAASSNHRPNKSQNDKLVRLKKHFYRFTHLPDTPNEQVINIGYTLPMDNPDFVIDLMDTWVKWKDSVLDNIPEGTASYAYEFGKRGFTFGEYKLVLSGKVKEDSYEHYRIFAYLYLTNQAERDYFTGINTKNESEVKEAYMEAITQTVKQEIPLLRQFLLETKIPLHINLSSLRLHSYILGMSGSGKSTLLKNIFYNLQRVSQKKRDKTLILLEPHGDLSSELIQFCLNAGTHKKRLVYLDPFIRETAIRLFGEDILGADYTFTINPFQTTSTMTEASISYLTQELAGAMFEVLGDEATNQMQAVIEACIDVLIRKEGASIADLKMMMDDDQNDELVNYGLQSPNVEVANMIARFKSDGRLKSTKSAIYYRLQSLIGDSSFRRLLVGNSTVNLEREMNSGKVIIFNLSKSKMGKKSAPAFGKLLIALLLGLAIKRQDVPASKRMETYLAIDEFQNYTTSSINTVMAEARKYKLYLTLANQVISQNMERSTKRAILGNTALKFAGANEPDSIEAMAKQMGNVKPERFNGLPKYSFFVHDKLNTKSGVHTLRVPDLLVKQQAPFFMNREQLKEVFKYLVFESGYYKKVEAIKTNPKETPPNSTMYTPNFDA